jgi:hypothetical protein
MAEDFADRLVNKFARWWNCLGCAIASNGTISGTSKRIHRLISSTVEDK